MSQLIIALSCLVYIFFVFTAPGIWLKIIFAVLAAFMAWVFFFLSPGFGKSKKSAAEPVQQMGEPERKTELPPLREQAVTKPGIDFDFGKGFVFSARPVYITEAELESYKSGERRDIAEKYRGCELSVYTGGQYPRVLRLWKNVPTFDSGDREYDSWHVLYLAREESGNLHAVYCKGGYRIAGIEGFAKMLEYPEELKEYLE